MATPPTPGPPHLRPSPWQSLSYNDVLHAPHTYGVVVVADARQEPLLVSPGVIREELWRLVNDPLAKAHGASFFCFYETLVDSKAEHLADQISRESTQEGRRLFWRHFPTPS
ncbi:MAG TPA: hypothetical protein VIB49_02515 [Thermoplasmata archaeon]|jgi:hypothetical protein